MLIFLRAHRRANVLHREKKESGVDEAHNDRDLKRSRKIDFTSLRRSPEEKHHQDRSAVEAVE
jgi:hypothetical protein